MARPEASDPLGPLTFHDLGRWGGQKNVLQDRPYAEVGTSATLASGRFKSALTPLARRLNCATFVLVARNNVPPQIRYQLGLPPPPPPVPPVAALPGRIAPLGARVLLLGSPPPT